MPISIELKKKCVELAKAGKKPREIYTETFYPEHDGMSYESFSRKLRDWKKKTWPSTVTLDGGTYEGFIAHGATVQVSADGEILQAWIKQTSDDRHWEDLLEAIHANIDPIRIEPKEGDGSGMLEVPLFDLHLPLSDHTESCERILALIFRQKWEEINLIVGQDLFHNDDMRGRTASGRVIEKVDISSAWETAKMIWYSLIEASLQQADTVNLIYSVGNHDESLAWAFTQLLKDHYPQLNVDDSMKQRKHIFWKDCFIGVTHGSYAKSANQDFRGQFTIEFPEAFARAKVREIHAGHLHHETEADIYGVMVRRLSRSGNTDKWSDDEGYVGAHKRFMIFEWSPGTLAAIHYV